MKDKFCEVCKGTYGHHYPGCTIGEVPKPPLERHVNEFAKRLDLEVVFVAAVDGDSNATVIRVRDGLNSLTPARMHQFADTLAALAANMHKEADRHLGDAPPCPRCGDSGITDGWVPTYSDPDNAGLAPPAKPCDCVAWELRLKAQKEAQDRRAVLKSFMAKVTPTNTPGQCHGGEPLL